VRVVPEDGQYTATCDALGVASCGDDVGEALCNVADAIGVYLATVEEEDEDD
jgi:predicted RNase H-like HicB family nuclease